MAKPESWEKLTPLTRIPVLFPSIDTTLPKWTSYM